MLTDDASCPGQVVGNALIGPLAANDAETDTHELLPGSPGHQLRRQLRLADQRGVSRPQGASAMWVPTS